MTTKPKPSEDDEICLMCRRPKSRHTQEEMLACSRKMKELEEKEFSDLSVMVFNQSKLDSYVNF